MSKNVSPRPSDGTDEGSQGKELLLFLYFFINFLFNYCDYQNLYLPLR